MLISLCAEKSLGQHGGVSRSRKDSISACPPICRVRTTMGGCFSYVLLQIYF